MFYISDVGRPAYPPKPKNQTLPNPAVDRDTSPLRSPLQEHRSAILALSHLVSYPQSLIPEYGYFADWNRELDLLTGRVVKTGRIVNVSAKALTV
jgi:hypothetical protein